MSSRLAVTALLLIGVVGCSVEDMDGTGYDISKLEIESEIYHEIVENPNSQGPMPEYIMSLPAKKLWVEPEGLYIRLNGSQRAESGIFVARQGVSDPSNNSYNPEFVLIEGRVYSYVID